MDDMGFLRLAVPGGADDQALAVLGANGRELRGGVVEAEVNQHIGLLDQRQQVVTQINLADHLQFRVSLGAGNERLAHATFGAGDDDFGRVQS